VRPKAGGAGLICRTERVVSKMEGKTNFKAAYTGCQEPRDCWEKSQNHTFSIWLFQCLEIIDI